MRRLFFFTAFLVFVFSSLSSLALFSQVVDSAALEIDTVMVIADTIGLRVDTLGVPSSVQEITSAKDSLPTQTNGVANIDSVLVETDSIPLVSISFEPNAAAQYLVKLVETNNLWRSDDNGFRLSIEKLLNHFTEPFDSVGKRLQMFPYDSLKVKPSTLVLTDTLPVRWLTSSSFIIDTVKFDRDPIILKKTIVTKESIVVNEPMSIPSSSIDSTMKFINTLTQREQVSDTIVNSIVDTSYLAIKGVRIFEMVDGNIPRSVIPRRKWQTARFVPDSSGMVFSKAIPVLLGTNGSPFNIVPNANTSDSLMHAVNSILGYTNKRDSMLLQINDILGRRTPFWVSSGRDDMARYWVKNSKNDSITIWIGNPTRKSISLVLEEDVNVERLERKMVDDIPFTILRPNRQLAELKPLREIPIFWHSELSSSFALNGNFLSKYWAKGGETTVSSMLDINGLAEYNNKEAKTTWTTNGRLRYGTTWTEAQKFRTNTDIIEANSQFNKSIREKIDFSSGVYMKTQLAKGYNHPNDSIPVSKFLNPGTFTVSSGFEFKPSKKLSLNFSPLSYKSTFVIDTITIDQTNHGIEMGKKVRHEMGGQLVINSAITIFKDMKIKNSVRLFSNYLLNPQNVDVDWEFSLEKQISWYFTIKLNSHLIYDDDILFLLFNDRMKEDPILNSLGEQKKGAKTQFSQFVGLTLSFKM
ncbi:MAG: DUF3078 domain-containing protein [Bacteroidales bacterium]